MIVHVQNVRPDQFDIHSPGKLRSTMASHCWCTCPTMTRANLTLRFCTKSPMHHQSIFRPKMNPSSFASFLQTSSWSSLVPLEAWLFLGVDFNRS